MNASGASGSSYTGPNAPPVMNAAGLQMNIVSALCYIIPVVCPIIFLLVDPYKRDKTVRFACFQSLFLSLSFIVINEVIALLTNDAYQITRLTRLAELVLMVVLAFKAFQNERLLLPVIGPLAQKQA